MSESKFEKGDSVVLTDKHSEFDGEAGEVVQVSSTMFDDYMYEVEFDDGNEQNVPEGNLESSSE